MRVLGFDPGGMTGIAVWNPRFPRLGTWMLPPTEAAATLRSLVQTEHPDLVVGERFHITPHTHKLTRQYDALELIGWVRYCCAEEGVAFELQEARDALKMPLPRSWHTKGPDHADSAARQVLLALLRHAPEDYARITSTT